MYQIDALKQEYEELATTIQRNNNRIVSMTEELAATGGTTTVLKAVRGSSIREVRSQASGKGML